MAFDTENRLSFRDGRDRRLFGFAIGRGLSSGNGACRCDRRNLPFPMQPNAICGNTLRASDDTIYVMNVFVWSQWLFKVPATALAVLYCHLPAFCELTILL